ncbi:MAG: sugar transferase [Micropruina sp.]|nr:sugar transferase [Micropruina sp.]
MTRSTYDAAKRAVDLIAASAALVVSLPLQLLIAVLVWRDVGRPILFRQARPGKDGQVFNLVKFRTMHAPTPTLVSDDDRLTPLGRLLRAYSLDELPSLWNVITGEMSLVGPRPLLVQYLNRYNARQARRHEVRPGLTGLAQISGRNGLDWQSRLELDVIYVDTRSWALDVRILWGTVGKVLRREGISAEGEATMPIFTGSQAEEVADEGR